MLQRMPIPVENFYLDPNFQGTLQARIQQMIAQGILIGRFRTGERLPSTRALAKHLKVSRLTVTLAYTELLASDYLSSRDRSGYFVSETAPEAAGFTAPQERTDTIDWTRAIGQRLRVETGRKNRRIGHRSAILLSMGRQTQTCLIMQIGGFAHLLR